MERNKNFAIVLLGSFLIYFLLEVYQTIEPKQFHIEQENYPTNITYTSPMIASGTSIYPGPVNFIKMGGTES